MLLATLEGFLSMSGTDMVSSISNWNNPVTPYLILPSLFWCLLRLQHFILPCASEDNIFIFSKALIYPKLSWIALLYDKKIIAI